MERGDGKMIKNIWLLRNGYLNLERSVAVTGTGYGEKLKSHIYSALIETTDKGYILVDTGMNTEGIKEPEATWGPRAALLKPILEEKDDVCVKLEMLGIKSTEISYVINTHMHWDHTGGHRHFKDAVFVVQKAELANAYQAVSYLAGSYMKNHYDFDLKYETVEGDVSFCEGVDLIYTPGHTPGHMSVLLTMGDKRYIIPGDAVYTSENLSRMMPPGNVWSGQMAHLSLHRLVTLSRLLDAIIIPSHEEGYDWNENGINQL